MVITLSLLPVSGDAPHNAAVTQKIGTQPPACGNKTRLPDVFNPKA